MKKIKLNTAAALALMIAAVPSMGIAQEYEEEIPQGWCWSELQTQDWPNCDQSCLLQTIGQAQSVVMFHTTGELQQTEGEELIDAIRRGLRVEIYVGKANNLSDSVISYAEDAYQKWAATAKDTETWLIGMGGCVMGKTDEPSFVITDAFAWRTNESPALVVDGKKTLQRDVAAAASIVVDTGDILQCKLKN